MDVSHTKTQLTNTRYPIAMNEVTTWLNNTEEQLESVARQMSAAQWTLYSEGKRSEVDEKTQAFQESFGNFETWKRVQELHLSDTVFAPQTRRRIELLYRILSREHVRSRPQIHGTITDAVSQLTRFRAKLFESSYTDSELQKILNAEPDRATREAAWRARTEIAHSLKQPILDLAILRNKAARALGFSGFREIGLLTAGQDCNNLKHTLKHLKQSTDEEWVKCVQRQKSRLGLERLRPWDMHFEDPELNMQLARLLPKEETLKHMKQSFLEMGIDLDRSELTMDMESRDGKSQHAYCFPIDPPHDVRVLANISDGLASCETLFHEMGHAVQALNVKQNFYSLKDTPNDALSEGCAQLFAYLCHEPEWLKHSLKLDDKSIARIQTRNRAKRLASLRWMLIWV
ncbi:MAG TPA: hypothetical protein EYN06_06155, partial [Myxococcales bacterium]|nr:hypothetical protein [Myxococcales bacterium]